MTVEWTVSDIEVQISLNNVTKWFLTCVSITAHVIDRGWTTYIRF